MPKRIGIRPDHLLPTLVLTMAMLGCKQSPPPEPDQSQAVVQASTDPVKAEPLNIPKTPELSAANAPKAGMRVIELPFAASASDVLVEDVDGDGRLDIVFTSHGENFSQIFFQREARGFEAGPHIMAVGFHPGNLIKLPIAERSAYLMSAEGDGRLYTLEAAEDGSLAVVAQARIPSPRFATTFRWPGWGLGVMAVPFRSPSIILLKQYDPHKVKAALRVDLQISGTAFTPQSVATADLDGDGADELILPLYDIGTLKVIRYPGPDSQPAIETLWNSPRLGPVKHIVAADVNSDGKIDLLAPQEAPKPEDGDQAVINILLNDGKGSFSLVELPFATPPPAKGGMPGIRAMDTAVDQDGLRYLLAAGYQAFALYQLAPGVELSTPPSRQLPFEAKEGIFKVVLRDVDGDSWLDAVVARGRDHDAGLVIFGPLWEHFTPAATDRTPSL